MSTFVLTFPGQGSQAVGMGKNLAETFPVARQLFHEADEALGFRLSTLCFEGPEKDLQLTANTQPAILTVSIAALRVLQERIELDVAAVAGHSLGEYSALVCADALDFADAVRIVRKRGEFMQDAVPPGVGTMAAIIGLDQHTVAELCTQSSRAGNLVELANINSPGQYVVSGHVDAVTNVVELAKEAGARRALLLPVSAPFHCELMKPAANRLEQVLNEVTFNDLKVPLVNNADAAILTKGDELRTSLLRQMYRSVQWVRSIERLLQDGADTFIEVGPGKVLSALLRRIEKKAVALNVCDVNTLEQTVERIKG
ncbi:[acyl-carrier-protein] S-malonyltransferase [candidate division KSB3 bacterium]|uniref:Malonyl CoA-acyl carrier protein transacylase n=1 Tax=candidate division KSB3 bacterium TaxID=2044937 RepID=A0A2G6EAN0_9BACT|nr:MAG: [acyl-carrier-protein] S-malonyltransferase [candidate division KSB3 bacterium]PIE30963.1 MAG: [acyl-carrier-protein] S-malonyltransferase [candidate division KSB3 bacterium]